MNRKEIESRLNEISIEMRGLMDSVKDTSKEVNLDEVRKRKAELEAERSKLEKDLAEFQRPAEKPEGEERKEDKSFLEFRGGNVSFRTDMTAADGGKAIAPEQFVDELIKDIEKECPVYALVKKIPVTGAGSLGLPYEQVDASDAAWTEEVPSSEITADTSWKFGKKQLSPTDLTKLIKISKKMLAVSALPIENLTREKLREKFTAAFENAILNGTGVVASGQSGTNQPLGLFVASSNGISTARDVECGAALSISADDFINAYMALRPAYRKNAVWIMNTQTLKAAMKLKDLDGQYIWQQSLREGEPSTILGRPVIESEYAPTGSGTNGAWAAGDYAAVFGDLRYYQFAYWKGVEITLDNLTFAGKNQVGIYGHTLADGQPTLEKAFSRLKIKGA